MFHKESAAREEMSLSVIFPPTRRTCRANTSRWSRHPRWWKVELTEENPNQAYVVENLLLENKFLNLCNQSFNFGRYSKAPDFFTIQR